MALHRPFLGDVLNVTAGSILGKSGNPRTEVQVRAVATNEIRVRLILLEGEVARTRSMPRGSPVTRAPQTCRRNAQPCRASWNEEISKSEDLDAENEVPLDSSVFEEVYPSVRRVVKPVGSRVRGLPIPQSTLIPDDWKDLQQYLQRDKKERKQETLALQLEWAKRRALEDRLTLEELKDDRSRGEHLVSAGAAAVSDDNVLANEEYYLETGVGMSSNGVSGRAWPWVSRSELQPSSVEEIAQTLSSEAELESSSQVEAEPVWKEDSEVFDIPETYKKKPLLTAEERAMLKNKKLDFARISSNKWSPLHTLAAAGQVYLAAELLKRAVDLDAIDSDGLTPLHKAVQAGRKTMARMLLKAGANAKVLDIKGATLLHYSARNGDRDMSKLLLRHGVNVNTADANGWTPLHVAVQSGQLNLVKALVYRGADVGIANKDGNTALDLALGFGGCFNFYETIKFLKKVSVLGSLRRTSASDEDSDKPT